jgi:hypothetical protein
MAGIYEEDVGQSVLFYFVLFLKRSKSPLFREKRKNGNPVAPSLLLHFVGHGMARSEKRGRQSSRDTMQHLMGDCCV